MILLIDTSTAVCRLTLLESAKRYDTEWEAGRELAKGLLGYLESELAGSGKKFSDLSGIGIYRGPGSFTGLRIGAAVLNTLAEALSIPIVGEIGEGWHDRAFSRLEAGENDRIVLPLYGSEANITRPRK
jgi:tRNA threonylcarbamoyladenosine biosynthesis protein TsaB